MHRYGYRCKGKYLHLSTCCEWAGKGGVAGGAGGLLKEMLFPQRKAEYLHLARGKFSGGSINQFLKI